MSVRIIPLSKEEKEKIYSKFSKKELIAMLISANNAIDTMIKTMVNRWFGIMI